ncbi:MAG: COX15/CtaA family protein [Alphaproteobacteria bacterium]
MTHRRQVGWWLLGMAALLVTMVVVGGATRLTDSGLSITEWRPVTGALPPLSAEAWESEFAKYRQIPEYQQINQGMSLAAFKVIYYWEWGHRLLGRLIGAAFLAGLLYFHATRKLDRPLALRLWGLFILGGLQGALGWYMVQSGLVDRVDVSQYRLAAHLGLALFIFACITWVACDLLIGPAGRISGRMGSKGVTAAAGALAGLVYLQCVIGAFVAGLDAGMTYNTWPLMDGGLVPAGLWDMTPAWTNLFENVATVQFIHRMTAYGAVIAALALALFVWRRPLGRAARHAMALLGAAVTAQALLGIWTLVAAVPLALGVAHQAGAVLVLAAAVHAAYRLTPARISAPAAGSV